MERSQAIFPSAASMESRKNAAQQLFANLHTQLHNRDLLNPQKAAGREFDKKAKVLAFHMKYMFEMACNQQLLLNGNDEGVKSLIYDIDPLCYFQVADLTHMKKSQQLIAWYFRVAAQNKYCKEGEMVYRQVKNIEGEFVYAYEYAMDMQVFVFGSIFPVELHQYWFQCLTESPGTASHVISTLTKSKSEWFPDLVRNPDIHSFTNGLFCLSRNRFYFFKRMPGKRHVSQLSGNLIAMKHHKEEFPADEIEADMNAGKLPRHYIKVRMPAIHKIMKVQGFNWGERAYIFCLLGRMLRKVGQEDCWGVFLYFLGIAGTGKSSLLRLLAALFERRDVGYLNNALQKTFALDGIDGKHMYLALDIDEHFQLDQATWNSMVVGEEVAVTRKHKQPLTKPWESHGGAAGNRLPPWVDNSGSLARRLITIEFMTPVKNVDTNLFNECLAQLPRFLYVINSAYRHYVRELGPRSIKEVMPIKFKLSEKKALREMNVLVAVIETYFDLDERPRGEQTKFCLLNDFNTAYRNHCRANGVTAKSMVHSFYSGVFAKYGLEKVDPKSAATDRFKQSAPYIIGISVKADTSLGAS